MSTGISDHRESEAEEQDEEDEEEIEPKLKYSRLRNDLQNILITDAVSCFEVHPKFICVGSYWGTIHILDHQGNNSSANRDTKLESHTVAVNNISIDERGDYIASCSDDGKILVQGFYTPDQNQKVNVGRLVKSISLDPLYGKIGTNKRFVAGDDKLTLYEKTFLGRFKSTVLCDSEGLVRTLCWEDQFIAWSSDVGVRVYDINARRSLGLIKWEETEGLSLEKYRCNLRWANARTLLIGWVNTVRVCVIRRRSNSEMGSRDLAEYLVDPLSTFRTNYFICGLAHIEPFDHQLVVLGLPKHSHDDNKSPRPQLFIVEYRDHDHSNVCMDTLTLRDYPKYSANDYHLNVLAEENRFFVVAPRDVVVASPYDLDDRVQWLIQHGKFEDAMTLVRQQPPLAEAVSQSNRRFTLETVGVAYLDHLLQEQSYSAAGKLCEQICSKNRQLWEEQIFKFATQHQLRAVSPFLPRTLEFKLNPHIYEVVLYEYMKMDSQGFLNLVKEWDLQLYNTSAVINAVLEHLLVTNLQKNIYLEALALLYSYEKKYDRSLSMYLKLQHPDVFDLIKKYDLYSAIHDMIVDLMHVDADRTIAMLLERNRIAPAIVVDKLKEHDAFLYKYLDTLDKVDSHSEYHGKLVSLYATFARDKLLPFLRRSDHYPIQEALDICEKAKYYSEMVYLLGRIGDTRVALQLIIGELADMEQAIEFCREHNDYDLWLELIDHCISEPEFVTYLLQTLGTYMDPTILVERLKVDMKIPGLRTALVRMLCTYSLQVTVQDGCKKILIADYFNLHKKLVRFQQRGIFVDNSMCCNACHQSLISHDSSSNVIIYNCRHIFHEICLPDHLDKSICGTCYQSRT